MQMTVLESAARLCDLPCFGDQRKVAGSACIVTPDAFGLVRNGGIGTATYHQAKYFASQGIDVTLLYIHDLCESFDRRYWKDHYRDQSVRLLFLDEVARYRNTMFGRWFLERSMMVKDYLIDKDFDCVYFQDWQAAGFHAIQSKHVGLAFPRTQFAVFVNSPHEWVHENASMWAERGDLYFPYLKWCERYCCRYADFLQAPSQYVFDWLEEHGWTLASKRYVTPCIRLNAAGQGAPAAVHGAESAPDELRLAFFSRLETRKGLEVFLDALETFSDKSRVKRVCFLGREGQISPSSWNSESKPAKDFIRRRMKQIGIACEIRDDLGSDEAIAFLKQERLLAVMPSLAETFGLVVYECILSDIPFLCSDIPPFREMAHPDGIFGNTAGQLATKLAQTRASDLAALRHRIEPGKVNAAWVARFEEAREVAAAETPSAVAGGDPLVSVCVPYYNYGKYLPGLVRSLERSSYKNFEVVLVNDGSTDPFSNQVFEDCRKRFASKPNWRFLSKANGGIGQTRNLAARMATGDYLIFMDADNEAKPRMIETFVRCMKASGMDCLTCFLDCFNDRIEAPDDDTPLNWVYAPIGNAPEISLFENTIGDANFIIKRDLFLQVGGFKEDRATSFEDYDFLSILSLRGAAIDVIPESLVWYRVTTEGFSRTTNVVRNHRRVLRTYCESPERLDFRFLAEQILMPMYYHGVVYRDHDLAPIHAPPPPPGVIAAQSHLLHPTLYRLGMKLQVLLNRGAPQGTRRRRALQRVARWVRNHLHHS